MWLLVGDLHLTDQDRDKYRFEIFDWIKRQQVKYPVAATFLAGDLTDSKNRHSADLVNKVVDGLRKIKPPVYICCGNHDYHAANNPFFRFLNHIDGIVFVHRPQRIERGASMAIIPHYRNQAEFTAAVNEVGNADSFLVHQTFQGAIAETGAVLTGLSASPIELLKPRLGVYAGDVHRPQRQGNVTYIGCPYHVRFGDGFTPRCLFVDESGKRQNLYYGAPYKWSLTISECGDILLDERLRESDQVKLTVELPREEAVEWKRIKSEILAACKEKQLELFGCKLEVKASKLKKQVESKPNDSPFDNFCRVEGLPDSFRTTGAGIMGRLQNGNKRS